jgi:hypothetical protein
MASVRVFGSLERERERQRVERRGATERSEVIFDKYQKLASVQRIEPALHLG